MSFTYLSPFLYNFPQLYSYGQGWERLGMLVPRLPNLPQPLPPQVKPHNSNYKLKSTGTISSAEATGAAQYDKTLIDYYEVGKTNALTELVRFMSWYQRR